MSKYKYLSFDDRKMIEQLYSQGLRPAVIASRLGVCFATVYRELKRGYTGSNDSNMRPCYSAEVAERALQGSFQSRGRKPGKKEEGTV